MRSLKKVIMHCSATPDSDKGRWFNLDVEEVRRWHVDDNGWSDIGYHFFIKRDGELQIGRPLPIMGAHTKGHNDDSVGVCYAGTKIMTDAQMRTARKLQKDIEFWHDLGVESWDCHNKFANKDCPGFTKEILHDILTNSCG